MVLMVLAISTMSLGAASLNVEELSIIADGGYNLQSDKFEMNTYFKFVTSFDGGYKFAARVAFESNVQQLAKSFQDNSTDYYNKAFMIFDKAEVSARNLANNHLDLTFWTGTYKYLGEGNEYRGYLYYPESEDVDYRGFYRLRGTGLSLEMKFWEERFRGEFHLYQNTNFVNSTDPLAFYYFSFDTRAGLYLDYVHFELFGGMTFPVSRDDPTLESHIPYGRYKAGLSFWVGNEHVDFFTSFGLPSIDQSLASPTTTNVFDLFYLMGELHFKLFITDWTFSFLTRPLYFNERKQGINNNGEILDFDVNFKFHIIVPDFPLNGGLVLNAQISQNNPNDNWHLFLSPFLSISLSGVIWELHTHYDFSRIYQASLFSYDYRIALEGFKVTLSASSKF
jgi:hypothetical protein